MTTLRVAAMSSGLIALTTAATIDLRRVGLETPDPQGWSMMLAAGPALALAALVSFDRRTSDVGLALTLLAAWLSIGLVGGLVGSDPARSVLATGVFAITGLASVSLVRTAGWTPLLIVLVGVASVHGVAGFGLTLLDAIEPLTDERRLVLLAYEPNHLARVAALGSVAAVALGLRESRSILHFASWPVAVICALAVLLTQSRTAAAAMAAAMAIPVVRATRPRVALSIAACGMLAIGLIGVSGLAGPVVDTLSRTGDRSLADIRTGNGRTELWPAVMGELGTSPIVGIGLGNDVDVISQMRREGQTGWLAEHAHSLPLHVLLTSGFAGFAAFFGAVLVSIRVGWRRADPWPLALLVLVLVDGVSEAVLSTPGPAWLLVVGAGLPVSSAYRRRRRADQTLTEVAGAGDASGELVVR